MLQWMGGSRRKVTSSRNSQHKRQKQYFEQRKRQQQKTAELQGSADGANLYGQHQKEHRSLDILSLLNVKADDRAMSCPAVKRKENVVLNAPQMKDYSTEHQPTFNTVAPMNLVDREEAGTPSQCHVETGTPNKILARDPDCHINSSKGIDNKSGSFRTPTEQHFSVLDLVNDDEPSGMPEEVTGHEAHVAFAVEGLGKVGTETPVHSPQQPGRTFPYGCSSSSNGARKPNSLKNLDNVMDELELQVNGMIQNIDMTLGVSSFDCSMNGTDPSNNLKQKLSTPKSSKRYDCNGYRTKSSFYDSYNIASNDEDVWEASSSILDDKVPEEGYDLSRKNWSYQMRGMSPDPLNYRDYDMLDYNFEGPLLKKRNAAKATDGFKISEPQAPYFQYQVAEDYYNSNASNTARPPSEPWKFDFGEITDATYWTSLVKEHAGDSYSLVSEESCSSSAVRGEAYHDLQSYSRPRDNRGRRLGGNALNSQVNRNNAKNICARELQYNLQDIQQGHNVHRSGNYSGVSYPSKSKPWSNSASPFRGKVEPLNSWLFEEGFTSGDARSGFHSFSGTSDAKLASSRSKHWTDNSQGVFVTPEAHDKSVGDFKHGECPPSSSSFSRNFVFDQPFTDLQSLDSPVWIGPTKADLFPDCEVDGTLPGSSHISGSNAKTRMQSSVRKEECASEIQPFSHEKIEPEEEYNTWNNSSSSENVRAVVASNSKGNDSECKEAKKVSTDTKKNVGTTDSVGQEEDTSSSVKISGQSEWSLNDKEYQQDVKNPLPCQSPCKGMKDAGVIDEKMEGERGDAIGGSSSPRQVLMLESYVLQLLCVQKILKAASAQHTLEKE